jgi:hypothetical protein
MPINETPADRLRERAILDKAMGYSSFAAIHQMPLMYSLDAAGEVAGRITRYIEVKERKCKFEAFPDGLFVSANKVATAKLLHDALGVPTSLLIQFEDGLYTCPIEAWDRERGVFWWGRDDGREGDEDGPTVAYPWAAFRRLDK